jgi:hypothetical protein
MYCVCVDCICYCLRNLFCSTQKKKERGKEDFKQKKNEDTKYKNQNSKININSAGKIFITIKRSKRSLTVTEKKRKTKSPTVMEKDEESG